MAVTATFRRVLCWSPNFSIPPVLTDSNYRAPCRARSRKEFIAKIGGAVEEADESLGWLESLRDAKLLARENAPTIINRQSAIGNP